MSNLIITSFIVLFDYLIWNRHCAFVWKQRVWLFLNVYSLRTIDFNKRFFNKLPVPSQNVILFVKRRFFVSGWKFIEQELLYHVCRPITNLGLDRFRLK